MLKGKSRLCKNIRAKTLYLTIPACVVADSAFPFVAGEEVAIVLERGTLVVEKLLELKEPRLG